MDQFDSFIGFARLVLLALVPYVLASQGTMLSGRTGIFNVAQEGIMLLGASIGFLVALYTKSLLIGIIAAAVVGGIMGLAWRIFPARSRWINL